MPSISAILWSAVLLWHKPLLNLYKIHLGDSDSDGGYGDALDGIDGTPPINTGPQTTCK